MRPVLAVLVLIAGAMPRMPNGWIVPGRYPAHSRREAEPHRACAAPGPTGSLI